MTDTLRSKRWKQAITIVTLLALFGFAYALRTQILETFQNLKNINLWIIILIIPLEVLNYHAQAKLYQDVLRLLGQKISYRTLYRVSLEMNFVNNVFPSAGVSGFSYFSLRLKPKGVSAAQATLVQMMKFILIFVAFQVMLFIGLLALAIDGRASGLLILVAGSLATLLLVGTLLLGYIVGSKERIDSFFVFAAKVVNRLIHIVRPKHPETINIGRAREVFRELHENYLHLKNHTNKMRRPLLYALSANLTEVLVIYMVYVAFGQLVNPGAIIIAYAVANFAGLVSVLPGGVGIYEALMTGVLAAGGISPALSLPVTVMYRVLNMGLQLPPGYILYQRALHHPPEQNTPVHST